MTPTVQENITRVGKVTLHVWTSNWGQRPRKLCISGTVDVRAEAQWAYLLPSFPGVLPVTVGQLVYFMRGCSVFLYTFCVYSRKLVHVQ